MIPRLPLSHLRAGIPVLALALLLLPGCDEARSPTGNPTTPIAEAVGPKGPVEVRELDAAAFDPFTQTPGKLVVVDYYADWCGPCRELGPVMEAVAGEFSGRVVIGKVNVDKAGDLAQRAGVHGIPDVRIYRDGKQVDQFVGSMPAAEIRGKFAAYAPEKAPGPSAHAAPPTGDAAPQAQAAQPAPAIHPEKKMGLPAGMEKR